MSLTWERPQGCTTPRAWASFDVHPDAATEQEERKLRWLHEHRTCGWWLAYGASARHRDGMTILASAYVYRDGDRHATLRWCATPTEAEHWIEAQHAVA